MHNLTAKPTYCLIILSYRMLLFCANFLGWVFRDFGEIISDVYTVQ